MVMNVAPKRVAGYLLLANILGAIHAAEYPPLTSPDITVTPSPQGVAICADWGVVSETIIRRGEDCDNDVVELHNYVSGKEFTAWFTEHIVQSEKTAGAVAKVVLAEAEVARKTVPQNPGIPTSEHATCREVAPLLWQQRIPWEVRKDLCLAVIDFRDERQVVWALALTKSTEVSGVFAVGWNNQAEVDGVIAQFPAVANLVRVNDFGAYDNHASVGAWISAWGITSLPACIRFPNTDSVLITEGLAP